MANNVTVKDGALADKVFKTTDNSGVHTPHHNVDTLTSVTQLPTTLGAKAASASLAVTSSTEDVARVGATNETAPTTDTAAAGLNGRLQRIAQRLTALIALLPASLGQKAKAASFSVTIASDDDIQTKLTAITTAVNTAATAASTGAKQDTMITHLSTIANQASSTDPVPVAMVSQDEYEAVAAGQTNTVLGATGAVGDYLAGLLVIPASTSPGAVQIKDGSGAAITVFAGGASSLSNLVSFYIPLGIKSTSGAWQVTTGTGVSVLGVGNFT